MRQTAWSIFHPMRKRLNRRLECIQSPIEPWRLLDLQGMAGDDSLMSEVLTSSTIYNLLYASGTEKLELS